MKKRQFYALGAFIIFTLIVLGAVVIYEVIEYMNYRIEQEAVETSSKTIDSVSDGIDNDSTEDDDSGNDLDNSYDQSDDMGANSEESYNQETESLESVQEGKSNEEQILDKDITMVFTGDVLLSSSPLSKYDSTGGIHGILSDKLLMEMNDADITMVNEEFPFSNRGTQMQDKQYTFRTDPNRVGILHEMGVDIVSLANNHTLDYGIEALQDTLQTLKNEDILSVGAGENLKEARKTAYLLVKGRTIAFLSASRVIPVYEWNATETNPGLFTTYDSTALLEEISLAKENSDFTVVYVHWGVEKHSKPEEYQRTLAKQYIDAGADIVIGSHPHVLQGIEFYQGKPIVYSLGNFVFGDQIDQAALLKVHISKDDSVSLSMLPCSANDSFTDGITKGNELQKFYDRMKTISYDIDIDSVGSISPSN